MKYLRYLGMVFAILFVLAISAIFWTTQHYDPNDLKPRITSLITEKTGRQLVLGELHWAFFPNIGLRADNVILANPIGFGDGPFASLKTLKISVKLLPLLKKHLEIDALTLDKLQINLIKNSAGRVNWQFNPAPIKSQAQQTMLANNIANPGQIAGLLADLGVAKFAVTDSILHWRDEQQHQDLLLTKFNMSMSDVAIAKTFPLEIEFAALQNNAALMQLQFNAQLKFDQAMQHLNVQKIQLKAHNNQQQSVTIHADANLNLTNQAMQIDNLVLEIPQWQSATKDSGLNMTDLQLTGAINIVPGQASLIRRSRLNGQLAINKLAVGKFALTHITAALHGASGLLQFSPVKASLYEGTTQGQFSVDLSGETPRYQVQQAITKVQLQPMLHDLKVLEKFQLSGLGNLNIHFVTQGSQLATLISNLSGNGDLAVNDGVLQGIDLVHMLDVGSALLRRETPPTTPAGPVQTSFGNLTGSFSINHGLLQNKDLLLQSAWMRATGKGSVDLNRQQLDYYFEIVKMNRDTQQAHQDIVPIIVNGPFSDITIKPDVQAILKHIANKELQKRSGELQQRLADQVEKKLGKNVADQIKNLNLQGLFR